MSNQEQQEEELEVLQSIYEGDDCFKEVNSTTFQYKYGEEGSNKCFNVEIVWDENYPEEAPSINLETFYNKHVTDAVKENLMTGLIDQVPDLLGCAMTYTLFEWVKENYDDLIKEQPDVSAPSQNKEKEITQEVVNKKEKKEQLTKNQKRKLYDRLNTDGERPRGWNWVDIIKHLSQSGSQKN